MPTMVEGDMAQVEQNAERGDSRARIREGEHRPTHPGEEAAKLLSDNREAKQAFIEMANLRPSQAHCQPCKIVDGGTVVAGHDTPAGKPQAQNDGIIGLIASDPGKAEQELRANPGLLLELGTSDAVLNLALNDINLQHKLIQTNPGLAQLFGLPDPADKKAV